MSQQPIYIIDGVRTPIGAFLGALSNVHAAHLGGTAIKALLERTNVPADRINEVLMGCVLPAGQGQAPARQAMRFAGIPDGVGAVTVNKVCGSGLKTVMMGATSILAGEADLVVAGGMECMSQVPYYASGARTGFRMGHQTLTDGMIYDGLCDPYDDFHMGNAGEKCADKYKFSREAQDEFSARSYHRAQDAVNSGKFKGEITPVSIPQRKGDPVV
ncbi:MAG: acetyl-CoA C-acyltransferase, partial [Vampirovibrio sp.]|nr:acetyl-CoA C-acyltransferase [Vampirovibrio sp.]